MRVAVERRVDLGVRQLGEHPVGAVEESVDVAERAPASTRLAQIVDEQTSNSRCMRCRSVARLKDSRPIYWSSLSRLNRAAAMGFASATRSSKR